MRKKKSVWKKSLIYSLGNVIAIRCMTFTVGVVVVILMYFEYHGQKCAEYQRNSSFMVGDIILLRMCPMPDELVIDALVESYSDGVPDV